MDHVIAERRDSGLLCPNCTEKMVEIDYPSRPMPNVPQNAENVSGALGKAYCQSCDKAHSWEYRTT